MATIVVLRAGPFVPGIRLDKRGPAPCAFPYRYTGWQSRELRLMSIALARLGSGVGAAPIIPHFQRCCRRYVSGSESLAGCCSGCVCTLPILDGPRL